MSASGSRRKSTIKQRDVCNDLVEIEEVISDDNMPNAKNVLQTEKEKTPPRASRRSMRKLSPNKKYFEEHLVTANSPQKSPLKPKKRRDRTLSTKALENLQVDEVESSPEILAAVRKSARKSSPAKRYIEETETNSKIPKTPKTPKKQNIIKHDAKTPHTLRAKIRKELKKITAKDCSDSDFSGDESDYHPDEAESSESEDSNEEIGSDSDEASHSKSDRKVPILDFNVDPLARNRYKNKMHHLNDFVLQSDDFFHHSSSKALTSDRTLDCLKNPRLQHDELFKLLASMKISPEHEKCIGEMMVEYKSYFKKWMLLLDENFSIILYGLGSKRNLIQSFHKVMLVDRDVLVVNGFFPSLNIKDILENLANKLLELDIAIGNLNIAVDLIEKHFEECRSDHIFLLVHNIDGVMLRNDKAQTVLSRLAKIPNIHLLASLDHINAPMLWNAAKIANYNFSWWDVTTMLPYKEETAFENSLLVQNSGALALSSMKNVFQSLTTNAKGIYLIIVKYQTQNKDGHYQGMPFKELYSKCRESFLVSSDLALRAQLTEFLDHKLVRLKRAPDGTENLNIPIDNKLLQQFLEQNN